LKTYFCKPLGVDLSSTRRQRALFGFCRRRHSCFQTASFPHHTWCYKNSLSCSRTDNRYERKALDTAWSTSRLVGGHMVLSLLWQYVIKVITKSLGSIHYVFKVCECVTVNLKNLKKSIIYWTKCTMYNVMCYAEN